jgi:hypothetical protein
MTCESIALTSLWSIRSNRVIGDSNRVIGDSHLFSILPTRSPTTPLPVRILRSSDRQGSRSSAELVFQLAQYAVRAQRTPADKSRSAGNPFRAASPGGIRSARNDARMGILRAKGPRFLVRVQRARERVRHLLAGSSACPTASGLIEYPRSIRRTALGEKEPDPGPPDTYGSWGRRPPSTREIASPGAGTARATRRAKTLADKLPVPPATSGAAPRGQGNYGQPAT